jgi:hypothetical protein
MEISTMEIDIDLNQQKIRKRCTGNGPLRLVNRRDRTFAHCGL